VIGLILVALVSLAFAGYVALNPSTSTVTQQQFVTNTQTVTSLQTQTVNVLSTSTSVTTVTSSQAGIPPYGYGNYYYQTCDYYGCYYQSPGYYSNPGYYYGYSYPPACQNTGSGNNVSCSGYLYQADNGCTLLAIYTANNPYPSYATTGVYEYFTLHNLPSIAPSTGSYVTVTGQLYQGYNTASNGASCPTDYINVSSIS
jgi:hypothetical protein